MIKDDVRFTEFKYAIFVCNTTRNVRVCEKV